MIPSTNARRWIRLIAAIHQSYELLQAYGDLPHSDELRLARGVALGSLLGAFLWGMLAAVVWLCI